MIEITAEYLASQGLSETFPERFWSKVKKTESCWFWTGAMQRGNYGCLNKGRSGLTIRAPKASWLLHFGPVPDELCVLHSCDNPSCVNPQHLWLGTRRDNTDDKIAKGRQLYGEQIGTHKLTFGEVQEARLLWTTGSFTLQNLADNYGVCLAAMHKIIRFKTWNHGPMPNSFPAASPKI